MYSLTKLCAPSPVEFTVTSETVQLADGTCVALRPMQEGDVAAVQEMHDRLSFDSLYYRYLHPYRPTSEELCHLARLDPSSGAAFVAVMPLEGKDQVIGLAYYQSDANDCSTGQPAFLVEDRYQNQGVGSTLQRMVVQQARANGIKVFDALIHPANSRMMHMIEKDGLSYEAKLSYGAIEVRISLQE